jgi:hypothetical protein
MWRDFGRGTPQCAPRGWLTQTPDPWGLRFAVEGGIVLALSGSLLPLISDSTSFNVLATSRSARSQTV